MIEDACSISMSMLFDSRFCFLSGEVIRFGDIAGFRIFDGCFGRYELTSRFFVWLYFENSEEIC